MTAEVTSALALNDAQVAELKKTLKESVGKDVTLNTRVDPSLLGGLVVKVGSRMIDLSLKTKLQNMKVALSGRALKRNSSAADNRRRFAEVCMKKKFKSGQPDGL